ncbi:hypothetical protein QOT17_017482 [Balamuthia mandrillaris]
MRCSNSVWTAVRLVGVVCLLSFNPLANGQTCELWDKQPELCSRFPGYHGEQVYIYVPEGSTLSEQVSYVAAAINVLGSFGQTYGDTGNYCNNRYLMLACSTHLRPCETVPSSTTNDGETVAVPLLIPRQPCRSLCLEYRSEKCIALTDSLGIPIGNGLYYPPGNTAPPVSCFNETEFGVPYFLEGNVTVPLDRFSLQDLPAEMEGMENFTLSCNEMSAESMELSCEYPLALDADNQRCSFECPLPSYSDEQYDNIKVLQLTFGWLSLVGSLLVALSYGLHPSLRSFPANLILMTALATNIATFAIILPTFATHETTWCGVDGSYIFPSVYAGVDEIVMTFNTNELLAKSHLCSFQGFVLMFGFLSTTMWWVIISFNMFLTVYFGKKLPTSRMWVVGLQVTFHVVGWVVPFVLTLIPTAADRMAFGPGDTFCFVSSEDDRAYFITFWALPVAIALLVGLVLFAAAIVRILHLAISLGEGKKACMTYYRLGLFILIFMMVYTFIFAYTLQVATNLEAIEDGYSAYFSCLLQSGLEVCSLDEDVSNYHLAALKGFAYAVLGFLLFLNFCLSEAVGRLWWKILKGAARGSLPSLRPSESSHRSKRSKKKRTSDKFTMSVETDSDIIP